jgi:exopolyphosphatase/guanosine-5'-triphosphate,3'-diphosphate pyrophosphatase
MIYNINRNEALTVKIDKYMKTETLGAIDIGSNAIRLLISNAESGAAYPDFRKTAFLRVPIRLGEDVFTKGTIGNEKKMQLIDAMACFVQVMKMYNVSRYKACATSAMREAENRKEIIDLIYQKSGVAVEIISGREEADVIFEAGKLNSIMTQKSNYLYVDVGGGSTEVVVYVNQQKVASNSFQLGTVRMLSNAVEKSEVENFENWLEQIYKQYESLSIIASGGNINKIHKILGKRDGEALIYPELQILYNTLSAMTYEQRMRSYSMDTYRADVIIPAIEIFLIVCNKCFIRNIYVPKVGVVDGIIRNLYCNKGE